MIVLESLNHPKEVKLCWNHQVYFLVKICSRILKIDQKFVKALKNSKKIPIKKPFDQFKRWFNFHFSLFENSFFFFSHSILGSLCLVLQNQGYKLDSEIDGKRERQFWKRKIKREIYKCELYWARREREREKRKTTDTHTHILNLDFSFFSQNQVYEKLKKSKKKKEILTFVDLTATKKNDELARHKHFLI